MRTLIALVLIASAPVCGAQMTPAISRSAINGEWTGTLVLDNSSPRLSVIFAITDSAFAGKVYVDGGLFGPMQDGSLNGSTVHFKVDRLDFTGVVTGARMKVDVIVYNGTTKNLTLTRVPDNPKDSVARKPPTLPTRARGRDAPLRNNRPRLRDDVRRSRQLLVDLRDSPGNDRIESRLRLIRFGAKLGQAQ